MVSPADSRLLPGGHSANRLRRAVAIRPSAHVRRIARDALAAGVGFGLGSSYALVGGIAADDVDASPDSRPAAQSSIVSAATWTDGLWPFTIESGELRCIGQAGDPGVFIAAANGAVYALNPAAMRMAARVGARADLTPIWRNDPDLAGAKANVSPMILHALKLC